MSKLFLVSVIAAGCQSRFRGGMEFTDEAKRIEVDASKLAVLESDRHLQVKVISEFDDAGATNDNAGTDTADSPLSSENTMLSEDMASDAVNASDTAFIIVDELENEPTLNPDADTNEATPAESITAAVESAEVSEASTERLDAIVEAMRGLELDVTADKPTVYALQAMKLEVSAKERDEAWDVLVKEHAESNA